MWRKGCGKRSKARIGPRKKTHVQRQKQIPSPVPVSAPQVPADQLPSQWLSNILIPEGWISVSHGNELRLCQISSQDVQSIWPLAVTRSIVVKSDYSWMIHVNNHLVDSNNILPFC